jgi:hypothetical protein
MTTHKVLVCGGRDYLDQEKIYHVLDAQLAKIGPNMLLINGGAPGADTIAREWAVSRKVDHLTLYAKWELFGRSAGPIRNRRMAKKKPKLVLAFHSDIDKSKGTRDMIGVAEKLKIKVKRFS